MYNSSDGRPAPIPDPKESFVQAGSPSLATTGHGGASVFRGLVESPWIVLLLLVTIFTARWIWIAGISGDYAWAYETSSRILLGEVPYHDYISSLPPLMSYTLAPLIALCKGNLWAWQLHLYLWWIASLVVGLRLLQLLGTERPLQSAAIVLAACLSHPASWTGVPHNYAGATFFGATLLAVLKFREARLCRYAALAGVCVTLTVLAKQNIGVAAFVAALLGLVHAVAKAEREQLLTKVLVWYALGGLAAFLPVLSYFAWHAGWIEPVRQMLLDGGTGKGLPRIAVNMLPIAFFERGVPHRHIWDVLVTVGVNSALLLWFARRVFRQSGVPDPARFTRQGLPGLLLAACLVVIVLLSAASLVPLPDLKPPLAHFSHYFSYGKLVFYLYASMTAFSIVCLAACWVARSSFTAVVCLWLVLLVGAFAMSLMESSIYATPISIPLFLFLLKEMGLVRSGFRLVFPVTAGAMLFGSLLPTPTFAPTFERLYPLPAGSHFAHLYAGEDFHWTVNQMLAHVSPQIEGHRTLWLTMGGPHLAYGGKPVRGVPLLHYDTHGLRAEGPLVQQWRRNPPDFVVRQSTMPVRQGSKYFTNDYLSAWLKSDYDLIWEEPRLDLSLWRHKPTVPPAAG